MSIRYRNSGQRVVEEGVTRLADMVPPNPRKMGKGTVVLLLLATVLAISAVVGLYLLAGAQDGSVAQILRDTFYAQTKEGGGKKPPLFQEKEEKKPPLFQEEEEEDEVAVEGESGGEGSDKLLLETTQGQIAITFLRDLAPKHVERISELVLQGFYNDNIFWRVIPGFMAQTGDPTGTGTGGSGTTLEAEFTNYEFGTGTVGMARAADPNSADSQFFICFEGCGHLTGQYTVWGQVDWGQDVVEKLAEGEPPAVPDRIVLASLID